jgi:ComB4 competence protein
MLGALKEKNNYNILKDYMPFIEMIDAHTIISKNGYVSQVVELTGRDYNTASKNVFLDDFKARCGLFESIPENITLMVHAIKDSAILSKENSINPYITKINDAMSNRAAFTMRHYLVFSTKLGANKDMSLVNLNNVATNIVGLLEYFSAHKLNSKELISFWYYITSGKTLEYELNDQKGLDRLLSGTDVILNDQAGYITSGELYSSFLTIRNFPDDTIDISDIWELCFDFRMMTKIESVNQDKVIMKLRRKKNQFLFSHFGGGIEEANDTGYKIESGEEKILTCDFIFVVYGFCVSQVQANREKLIGYLGRKGILLNIEGLNQSFCYFGQYPDYYKVNDYRKALLSSKNIADLVSFTNASQGVKANSFGNSPVCQFLTPNKTIYNFNFHISDRAEALGHTLIVGGTGSGKTTTTMYMLLQCLKYENMKILAFDSGNGFKIPFKAFNGDYLDLDNNSNIRLNPFSLNDTQNNRIFIKKWLELLAGGIEDDEIETIDSVIAQAFVMKELGEQVTLNESLASFGQKNIKENGSASLTLRMSKWFEGGVYESVFNHQSDSLNFGSNLVGFNMGKVINDPELLPAVTSYIFHAFMEKMSGKPHICFIDEMSKYLTNPIFARLILENFQELRKRNGIMIGAVQNVSDLVSSEIGNKLINNAGSYLLFPCSSASQANQYREGFNLNDREMSFIFSNSNKREVLWKRNNEESTILNIDLSVMGRNLKLLSSSARDVQEMERLEQEYQSDWVRHYV